MAIRKINLSMAASDKLSEAYISAAQRDDPPCSQPQRSEQQEWTAESLARFFHETYENLAPSFGYETRPETREFNPESKNGRLMITVCGAILLRFNAALAAAYEKGYAKAYDELNPSQPARTHQKHRNTKGESPIAIRNKAISDAHSAALAAYEKGYAKAYDELKDQIDGG
jgi:hypothetical protein